MQFKLACNEKIFGTDTPEQAQEMGRLLKKQLADHFYMVKFEVHQLGDSNKHSGLTDDQVIDIEDFIREVILDVKDAAAKFNKKRK